MELKILKRKARSFEKILNRTKFNYKIHGDYSYARTVGNVTTVIETEIFEIQHTAENQRNEYFVAGVTILTGDDTTRTFDITDTKIVPAEYHGIIRCDDCSRQHAKKHAIVLCNRRTREFKILGGGCMSRYIHGAVLSEYLHLIERFGDEIVDEERLDWSLARPAVDKYDLMFAVYREISEHGFVSKEESAEESTFTRLTEQLMSRPPATITDEFRHRLDRFLGQDSQLLGNSIILDVKAIFANESSMIDWEQHLSEFLFVALKMLRDERLACDYQQMPAGKYKGLSVVIDSIKNYSSMYGVGRAVNMIHEKHLLTWFTTTNVSVKEKQHYLIDVTVTDVFSPEFCSTKVTRVKFICGGQNEAPGKP